MTRLTDLEHSDEDQRKYETRSHVYRLSLVVNVNLFENLRLKRRLRYELIPYK